MPKDASKRPNPCALAIYRQESDAPARLELYDLAVVADRIRFSGSVDAPVTQSAAMLMHEVGHAISRAASRAQFALAAAATLYGRTAGPEAFAESFRMWKFDRVALERAAPGMAAWFDAQAPKP